MGCSVKSNLPDRKFPWYILVDGMGLKMSVAISEILEVLRFLEGVSNWDNDVDELLSPYFTGVIALLVVELTMTSSIDSKDVDCVDSTA